VVDREEEEEVKKKMISLWKKQGKAGEGKGVILTRRGTAQAPLPPPTTPLLPVRATLLTVDFGTPRYEFTVNICMYLIF
jgi:hypothetical protein